MQILANIPDHLESFVRSLVASGRYTSVDEAFADALLRLMTSLKSVDISPTDEFREAFGRVASAPPATVFRSEFASSNGFMPTVRGDLDELDLGPRPQFEPTEQGSLFAPLEETLAIEDVPSSGGPRERMIWR